MKKCIFTCLLFSVFTHANDEAESKTSLDLYNAWLTVYSDNNIDYQILPSDIKKVRSYALPRSVSSDNVVSVAIRKVDNKYSVYSNPDIDQSYQFYYFNCDKNTYAFDTSFDLNKFAELKNEVQRIEIYKHNFLKIQKGSYFESAKNITCHISRMKFLNGIAEYVYS